MGRCCRGAPRLGPRLAQGGVAASGPHRLTMSWLSTWSQIQNGKQGSAKARYTVRLPPPPWSSAYGPRTRGRRRSDLSGKAKHTVSTTHKPRTGPHGPPHTVLVREEAAEVACQEKPNTQFPPDMLLQLGCAAHATSVLFCWICVSAPSVGRTSPLNMYSSCLALLPWHIDAALTWLGVQRRLYTYRYRLQASCFSSSNVSATSYINQRHTCASQPVFP